MPRAPDGAPRPSITCRRQRRTIGRSQALSRRQFKNEGRDRNSRLANGITMAARPQTCTDHRQAQRLGAQHAPDSASGEARQKACYRGGTLAAGERVPADGGAEFRRSHGLMWRQPTVSAA
jgi:hypothetical protein